MIPVPWSASQEEDDSAEGTSSHASFTGKQPTDDMSVYLQHFLSVHSRVHMRRQGAVTATPAPTAATTQMMPPLHARRPVLQRAQLHQASTDTVRTDPPVYIAATHRITSPSPTASSHQNLIHSKSPIAVAANNSRLPSSSDARERIRAHTIGRSAMPQIRELVKAPVLRRVWEEPQKGSAPRVSTAPGASSRRTAGGENSQSPPEGNFDDLAPPDEDTSQMRGPTPGRVRSAAVSATRTASVPATSPRPPQQALQVTNSSSAWSSTGSHPPRPKKGSEPAEKSPPSSPAGVSQSPESSVGMRRRLGAKAAQPVTKECVEVKATSSSDQDEASPVVVNRVDKVEPPPPAATASPGRGARAAMSHNLVERRRRIVQPTVQMELLAPDRVRRATRNGANGGESAVGTIVEKEFMAHRSANLSSRRLIGSITTTAATPQTNYRFQQVGSTMPPGRPPGSSELLRRVIKEVGASTVLDGNQLELLLTTGRFARVGELLSHGVRREDLTRGVYRINSGTFCSVYLGRWQGRDVAVKCPHAKLLESDPLMMTHRAIAEWKILSQIDHPHIVKLIGGVVMEDERTIWLLTEYIHGGDVYNFLYHHRRGESQSSMQLLPELHGFRRLKLMEQLAEGLSYLHARRVVHKDIKCNNLLITAKDVLKICDFGDAEVLTGIHIQCCTAATWQYVSPELVCAADPSRPIGATELVDVWAMGCVFLEMVKCPTPFFHLLENVPEGAQRERLRQLYLQGALEPEISIPRMLPPKLKSLISRCLQFQAPKRNSSHQILHYLRLNRQQLQAEIDMWLSSRSALLSNARPVSPFQHLMPVRSYVQQQNPSSANPMSHSNNRHAIWPTVRPRGSLPAGAGSPRVLQQQPIFMGEKQF